MFFSAGNPDDIASPHSYPCFTYGTLVYSLIYTYTCEYCPVEWKSRKTKCRGRVSLQRRSLRTLRISINSTVPDGSRTEKQKKWRRARERGIGCEEGLKDETKRWRNRKAMKKGNKEVIVLLVSRRVYCGFSVVPRFLSQRTELSVSWLPSKARSLANSYRLSSPLLPLLSHPIQLYLPWHAVYETKRSYHSIPPLHSLHLSL